MKRRPPTKATKATWSEAELEAWEERAAIMEHLGGLSRLEAEVTAMHRILELRGRRKST